MKTRRYNRIYTTSSLPSSFYSCSVGRRSSGEIVTCTWHTHTHISVCLCFIMERGVNTIAFKIQFIELKIGTPFVVFNEKINKNLNGLSTYLYIHEVWKAYLKHIFISFFRNYYECYRIQPTTLHLYYYRLLTLQSIKMITY